MAVPAWLPSFAIDNNSTSRYAIFNQFKELHMNVENVGPINSLPNEMLVNVFSHLSVNISLMLNDRTIQNDYKINFLQVGYDDEAEDFLENIKEDFKSQPSFLNVLTSDEVDKVGGLTPALLKTLNLPLKEPKKS